MKKLVILAIVFLVIGLFVGSTLACGPDKDDVYFNKEASFFKVNLTTEKPKAIFKVGEVEGSIEKIDSKKVLLTYKGKTQFGKIYGVFRCLDTPGYIKWEDDSLNPLSIGGEKLADDFYLFMTTQPKSSKPAKYTHGDLTVTVNAEAIALMEKLGIETKERSDGLFWVFKGFEVNLNGDKNENTFILITVKDGALALSLTEKDGRNRTYLFDSEKNELIETTK